MDIDTVRALRSELCLFIAEEIRKFETRTGVTVEDPATQRNYQRLDLADALAHVFAAKGRTAD